MKYTRVDFGKALLKELERGYHPEAIAHWAFIQRADHVSELDAGLDDVMMTVIAMGEGPEFYLSEGELIQMAASLMKGNPQ